VATAAVSTVRGVRLLSFCSMHITSYIAITEYCEGFTLHVHPWFSSLHVHPC